MSDPYKSVLNPQLKRDDEWFASLEDALKVIAHETTFNTLDAISAFTFVRTQVKRKRALIAEERQLRRERGIGTGPLTPLVPEIDVFVLSEVG
jgi:hypothetical protein